MLNILYCLHHCMLYTDYSTAARIYSSHYLESIALSPLSLVSPSISISFSLSLPVYHLPIYFSTYIHRGTLWLCGLLCFGIISLSLSLSFSPFLSFSLSLSLSLSLILSLSLSLSLCVRRVFSMVCGEADARLAISYTTGWLFLPHSLRPFFLSRRVLFSLQERISSNLLSLPPPSLTLSRRSFLNLHVYGTRPSFSSTHIQHIVV